MREWYHLHRFTSKTIISCRQTSVSVYLAFWRTSLTRFRNHLDCQSLMSLFLHRLKLVRDSDRIASSKLSSTVRSFYLTVLSLVGRKSQLLFFVSVSVTFLGAIPRDDLFEWDHRSLAGPHSNSHHKAACETVSLVSYPRYFWKAGTILHSGSLRSHSFAIFNTRERDHSDVCYLRSTSYRGICRGSTYLQRERIEW